MRSRRGFVLTLDASVATLIAVVVISFSIAQINRVSTSPNTEHKMLQQGSDIVMALYNSGTLQTLDQEKINTTMHSLLSPQYDMRIEITIYEKDDDELKLLTQTAIGAILNESENMASGKITYLTFTDEDADKYALVQYWILNKHPSHQGYEELGGIYNPT
jgi:hypothetical protein